MQGLVILFCIGIGLSIDAFSMSTCIGLLNLSFKKMFSISFIVGIFHFIMPILGLITSMLLTKIINLNTDLILGIILILISLQMLIEYLKPSVKNVKLSKIGIFLFAFGVSLDSFSVGLGLDSITSNIFLASTVFTICSFSFTFLGLSIGKYLNNIFKRYAYLIGTILLFCIGILFFCKSL